MMQTADTAHRLAGLRRWGLPLALVLFALVRLLVGLCYRPPDPEPESAPAAEFSAGRARLVLRELLGDGSRHPTGSAANTGVRERVLAGFRRLGYQPEVEHGFACSRRGNCAAVDNVIARLEGREPGAVLLCAHYDSVDNGPGASDDLASVAAILEIARVLKSGPRPRHPVLFLVDDGEEAGLIGARAFVAGRHAREAGVLVNLDARGTSGPSLMFQTNRDNGWLIPIFARTAVRPMSSSLFVTIYEHTPNATDFTVFEQEGMQGLNFAYIGNPSHYHTPLDDLAHASTASLQHQGATALGVVRGLAASPDLRHPPRGAAVFFDLFGRRLIWWPESWSVPLAGLAGLLLAAATVLLLKRRLLTGSGLARGLLAFLAIPVGSILAALALARMLRAAGALRVNWLAEPRPAAAAFWLLAFAVGGAISLLAARRAGAPALWAGVWLGWGLLGLALAWKLPGASFLAIVPALVAGLAALPSLAAAPLGRLPLAVLMLPAAAAAMLWFPVAVILDDGLGVGGFAVVTLLVSVTITTLTPLFAESSRRLAAAVPAAAAVTVLLAAGLALAAPPFSRESPRKLWVGYHEDADTGAARWLVAGDSPAPAAMRRLAQLTTQPMFPWSSPGQVAEAAPAPGLGLQAPRIAVLADSLAGGKRRLRLWLTSPRGASSASLILPVTARIESATVGGAVVPKLPGGGLQSTDSWHFFSCSTLPRQGIAIDLVLAQTEHLMAFVADSSPGIAAAGQALAAARPETAVLLGADTVVTRRFVL